MATKFVKPIKSAKSTYVSNSLGGSSREPVLFGGQAIIEGVMFKSPSALSLAVRLPNGKIHSEATAYSSVTRRLNLHRVPILRGISVFVEMFYIGISYLNKSAELALSDAQKKAEVAKNKKSSTGSANSVGSSIITTSLLVISFIVSTILALLAFKFLPLELSSLVWNRATVAPIVFTLTEGLIKLVIFVLYLFVIGKMKDVHRVFQYHGAEHKTIRAFEAGKKLTIANVKAASRYHPRCGTSFVVFVILISVIVYSFLPLSMPLLQLFLIRIALLPLLAGISYEVLSWTAHINEKSAWSFMLKPGYFVQSLTTAEPTARQIEVAIAAFNACKNKTK